MTLACDVLSMEASDRVGAVVVSVTITPGHRDQISATVTSFDRLDVESRLSTVRGDRGVVLEHVLAEVGAWYASVIDDA